MAALASGQLDRFAGGVHGPVEQEAAVPTPPDNTLFSSVAKTGWALRNASHVSAIRLANDNLSCSLAVMTSFRRRLERHGAHI
eukprot:6213073-Pleurochrysis_carterae.AAC.1